MRTGLAGIVLIGCATQHLSPEGPGPALRVGVVPTVPGVVAGETVRLRVVGVDPQEEVVFVRGGAPGAGPCPSALGGACLDLGGRTSVLGAAAADALGVAVFDLDVPAAAAGRDIVFQAAVVRGAGGADSVITEAIAATVLPAGDNDADGFDASVDCDDADPAVFPGALEVCNGVDDDCSDLTNELELVSSGDVIYADLFDAVATAPAGEPIQVCGIHELQQTLELTRSLTFEGHSGGWIYYGGPNYFPAIEVHAGASFEDLTISGRTSGIHHSGGTLTLTRVTIQDLPERALSSTISSGAVRLEDVEVLRNGEAIHYVGGSSLSGTRVVIADNDGTGLFVDEAIASLTDCTITGNTARSGLYGGGVSVQGNAAIGTISLEDCAVYANHATSGGGGAAVQQQGLLYSTNTSWGTGADDNTPDDVLTFTYVDLLTFGYGDAETFECTAFGCQ